MRRVKKLGIKIRTAKDKHVRLVDRETGKWLANVRWRPCGDIWFELRESVQKELIDDVAANRSP